MGMTCRECQKLIPDFLGKKMKYYTLKRFCRHVESCQECHEELTIQFLMTEGLNRLEDGDAFDLNKELQASMQEAQMKIHQNEEFLNAGIVAELVSMVLVLCAIFWIILG